MGFHLSILSYKLGYVIPHLVHGGLSVVVRDTGYLFLNKKNNIVKKKYRHLIWNLKVFGQKNQNMLLYFKYCILIF